MVYTESECSGHPTRSTREGCLAKVHLTDPQVTPSERASTWIYIYSAMSVEDQTKQGRTMGRPPSIICQVHADRRSARRIQPLFSLYMPKLNFELNDIEIYKECPFFSKNNKNLVFWWVGLRM
jgi:hypothetical protein